jgi:hypothetical protein
MILVMYVKSSHKSFDNKRLRLSLQHSFDDTDARKSTVRRFGRSDRRAQSAPVSQRRGSVRRTDGRTLERRRDFDESVRPGCLAGAVRGINSVQ